MSTAIGMSRAGALYASLEEKTKARLGLGRDRARTILARELRCAPGTLTNLVKGRVKGVKDELTDRIEAALIRAVRSQIARLQDEEAAILDGSPRRNRARDLAEIEADLARLKASLGGEA